MFARCKNKAETLKMNEKQGLLKINRIRGKILNRTSRSKQTTM